MKKAIFVLTLILPLCSFSQYIGSGSVSQGLGTTVNANIFSGCSGSRVSGIGTITSLDSKIWTIPAVTQFSTSTFLPDLYNQCSGVTPSNISAVNLATIPTVVIDPSGTTITGYIFGDNYYELYINGVLVGVDPVPYTPFNSSIVKFKVSYPYTIAVKLVDWEENLGVGTELNGSNPYHAGDGGFIASFSDGTITDANWKAQTYYISPIEDLTKVIELPDSTRSSLAATTTPSCNGTCFAIHYSLPSLWKTVGFNDSHWPNATIYSPATVGVSSILAYTNFISSWSSAQFIWSSNLILDNEVVVRHTVVAPTSISDNDSKNKEIQIFPNPIENKFEINFGANLAIKDLEKIEIYNAIGDLKYETKLYVDGVNISDLSKGFYTMKIYFENYIVSKKIIIK